MSSRFWRMCRASASPTSSPRTWCATRWCSASSRPTSASRTSRPPAVRPATSPPTTIRAHGPTTMLELDLQLATTGRHPSEADLRRWCELALRQRSGDSELTIRLVDEEEGRELNRTWRHKDYATNVLSFPADVPDEFLDIPLLGDLVICVPVVEREAAEQGKTPEAHWAHLVIHGCLHLLGYDHIEDAEAEEMEGLERELLAELGHPDPYAGDEDD